MQKMININKGFTLIEILIVITIIGVLASVVVPRLMDRPDQARQTKVKQDIRVIESALDLYRLDNFVYPTSQQGLEALMTKPSSPPIPTNWGGPYLKRLPADPWGHEYIYANPGQHSTVDIFSYGSDQLQGGENSATDIGNWTLGR